MTDDKSATPLEKTTLDSEGGKSRDLRGWYRLFVYVFGVGVALLHIWMNWFAILGTVPQNALHFATMGTMVFLLYPAFRRSPKNRFTIFDVVFAVLIIVTGWYLQAHYLVIHREQFSIPSQQDLIFAGLAVLLLIEAARRSAGWVIPGLVIFFSLYTVWFGKYIPGAFYYGGAPLERFLFRMSLTDEGIFGLLANISSTYVFTFILFGAFLLKSGAGDFIINFARILTGRMRGGPAQAAVVASGMIGSITGSAVANTVTSGAFTIPLMKRVGYKARVAAAIEAAASTGGLIMPPVMGAGAFIMAQWTGVPYLEIVAISIIPAIMYFLTVGFFVYIEARKQDIPIDKPSDLIPMGRLLKEGAVFFLPIIALIVTLMLGYTPLYAGFIGIVSVIVASWLSPNNRMGIKDILDALYLGTRNAAMTAVILMAAGMIVGIAGLTGIGITFSMLILALSQGILLLAVLLIAFASLILGMGLPVSAAYVMLAVLAAPALVQMGIPLIAAHMLIFWYSLDSNVTPPIALAAYASAGVARSDPMASSFTAWKFAKGLYFIPLLFIYSPILFTAEPWAAVATALLATVGLFCMAVAFEGFFLRRTTLLERLLFAVAAVMLFWPSFVIAPLGIVLFGVLINLQRRPLAAEATLSET